MAIESAVGGLPTYSMNISMNLGVIVNSSNYDHCPELVARFRDRGDELIGHGISNGTERPIDMTESAEREMILDVTI